MNDALQRARELIKLGKNAEARQFIAAILKKNPNSKSSLAMLFQVAKSPDEQEQILRKLVALDPQNGQLRDKLVQFLYTTKLGGAKRLSEQEAVLRQILEVAPDDQKAKSALVAIEKKKTESLIPVPASPELSDDEEDIWLTPTHNEIEAPSRPIAAPRTTQWETPDPHTSNRDAEIDGLEFPNIEETNKPTVAKSSQSGNSIDRRVLLGIGAVVTSLMVIIVLILILGGGTDDRVSGLEDSIEALIWTDYAAASKHLCEETIDWAKQEAGSLDEALIRAVVESIAVTCEQDGDHFECNVLLSSFDEEEFNDNLVLEDDPDNECAAILLDDSESRPFIVPFSSPSGQSTARPTVEIRSTLSPSTPDYEATNRASE